MEGEEQEHDPRGCTLYAKLPKQVSLPDFAGSLLKLNRSKLFEICLLNDSGDVLMIAQADKYKENLIGLGAVDVVSSQNNETYQIPLSTTPFPHTAEAVALWQYSRANHIKLLTNRITSASKITVIVGDETHQDYATTSYAVWNNKFSLSKLLEGNPTTLRDFWSVQTKLCEDSLQPSPLEDAFKFIAYLEKLGKLQAVIDQDYTSRADEYVPNTKYLSLCGSIRTARCVICGEVQNRKDIHSTLLDAKYEFPLCQADRKDEGVEEPSSCGGAIRTGALLFGEAVDSALLDEAVTLARDSELVIMLGVKQTKLLPEKIKHEGNFVVLMQNSHTMFDDALDLKLQYPCASLCKEVHELLMQIVEPQSTTRHNKFTLGKRNVPESTTEGQ